MQIICFVDPGKFFFLGGRRVNRYSTHTNDEIIFIDVVGGATLAPFSLDKAKYSKILIISDRHEPISYQPEVPFKLKIHGETEDESYTGFLVNQNLEGIQFENEQDGSIYQQIGKLLGQLMEEEFLSKFDEIYKNIPCTNKRLSNVLDYLHRCFENGSISNEIEEMSLMGIDVSILKDASMNNLPDIRDQLLSQCIFN